eukprot:CAMPEP_0198134062 /NCGR_PEP_ID=MMETSP1442-20131203/59888_1 /TAXON_ID= /ORGANISM="Craspedostauros australis, Strain CCMP3328" /LENGTH=173 /DNA_ID=CAMNT_0043795201 /DNA_START=210 /DNA_END=728 /DNA_ORIENTATION=-
MVFIRPPLVALFASPMRIRNHQVRTSLSTVSPSLFPLKSTPGDAPPPAFILPPLVALFASPLRNHNHQVRTSLSMTSPSLIPPKSTSDDASPSIITHQDLLRAAEQGDMDTLTAWKTAFPQTSIDTIKDDRDKTALHFACSNGQLETIKQLMESCGANVNAKSMDGETALHYA